MSTQLSLSINKISLCVFLAAVVLPFSCTFPPTNEDLKLTVVNPYPDLCTIYMDGEALEPVVERSYWEETEIDLELRPLPGMDFINEGLEISGYFSGGQGWSRKEPGPQITITMTSEVFTVTAAVDRKRDASGFWLGDGVFAFLSNRTGKPSLAFKTLQGPAATLLYQSDRPLWLKASHAPQGWGILGEIDWEGTGEMLWVDSSGTFGTIPAEESSYLGRSAIHPLNSEGLLVASSSDFLWLGNYRGERSFLREGFILKYFPGASAGLVWIEGPAGEGGLNVMTLKEGNAFQVTELAKETQYGFYPRPGGAGVVVAGYRPVQDSLPQSFVMVFDAQAALIKEHILALEPASGVLSDDGSSFLFSGEGKGWTLDLATGNLREGPSFPRTGHARRVDLPGQKEDGALSPDGRYRMVYRIHRGMQRIFIRDEGTGEETITELEEAGI